MDDGKDNVCIGRDEELSLENPGSSQISACWHCFSEYIFFSAMELVSQHLISRMF